MLAILAVAAIPILRPSPSWRATNTLARPGPDGLGIKPGKIKHVWLIILENKSYDATFTGLNNNTYLWQTLPVPGRAAARTTTARGTSASTTTSRW